MEQYQDFFYEFAPQAAVCFYNLTFALLQQIVAKSENVLKNSELILHKLRFLSVIIKNCSNDEVATCLKYGFKCLLADAPDEVISALMTLQQVQDFDLFKQLEDINQVKGVLFDVLLKVFQKPNFVLQILELQHEETVRIGLGRRCWYRRLCDMQVTKVAEAKQK